MRRIRLCGASSNKLQLKQDLKKKKDTWQKCPIASQRSTNHHLNSSATHTIYSNSSYEQSNIMKMAAAENSKYAPNHHQNERQ